MIAAAGLWLMAQMPVAERRYTPTFDACMKTGDAARGVTAGMMDCLGAENVRQDRALNTAYRNAMARLPAARRARLRSDERTWIATRERRCAARPEVRDGGSLAGLAYAGCFLDATIARTRYLARVGRGPITNSLAPPAPPR